MIIDCHGHCTTAPNALEAWRNRQIAGLKDPAATPKVSELKISDDELRQTIVTNQLKKMQERGEERGIERDQYELQHVFIQMRCPFAGGG